MSRHHVWETLRFSRKNDQAFSSVLCLPSCTDHDVYPWSRDDLEVTLLVTAPREDPKLSIENIQNNDVSKEVCFIWVMIPEEERIL